MPSITYALRGLNYYEIEITGPAQDLHSGIFGGAVPNPLTILAELFAKLHDKNFRVTVPGFYDDVAPLSRAERKGAATRCLQSQRLPQNRRRAGALRRKGFSVVEQLWCRPTLELNGIWGGYIGEGAKTVIPSKAYAKFSTRLVPNQNAEKITRLVERHIRKLLPKTVTCKFSLLSTGKPWVAPYTHPFFEVAHDALEKGFGKRAVFIREGGSIPFVTQMYDTFKVPCILLGFGLPDENAHAPGRAHRAGKLFRRNQSRRAILSGPGEFILPSNCSANFNRRRRREAWPVLRPELPLPRWGAPLLRAATVACRRSTVAGD